MEQKIVIKICMPDHKSRRKAMQTAASLPGVASVELPKEDQMQVKGTGVDAVQLINILRKKFATKKSCCLKKKKGHASLVSVEEIKKPQQPKPPEKPNPPKETKPNPPVCGQCGCCLPCQCRRPTFVCLEEYPGDYCSKDRCPIM